MQQYGCVMLAGGRGSRMGGLNKAELEYGGRTFAERIAKELAGTGMPCYLSSAAYEQKLPEGWTLVPDAVTGPDGAHAGPMGGIVSCLRQARKDGLGGLFFAPCDAPLFDAEIVGKMLKYLPGDTPNTAANDGSAPDALVWRTGDGRIQTTFGWYSVSCLKFLEEDIRNNGFKLRRSLESIRCLYINTADEGIDDRCFMNVNNREDYRKILNEELRTKNLSKPISLEEGIRLLVSRTNPVAEKEIVPVWRAVGRTLAEDITATHDQPPFDRSPFDGYAIRSADSEGAGKETPVLLEVIGEVDAGSVFDGTVRAGQAVRIMTGAPIPDGADAVIKQEETDYGEDNVRIFRQMRYRQNNCAKGEDYKAGTVLLPDRSYIGAAETGIIASTGRSEVSVYRRPRVLLISTGDELTMPGSPLAKGKIYDSNLFTLGAILTEWGVEIVCREQASDDPDAVAEIIKKYAEDADLIITSGGVSVGKKDIMHDVFAMLGAERTFWKIGIKPGAAMLSGKFRGRHILALSGNPYAAYVDLHMVVRPVVNALNGNDHFEMMREQVVLADSYDRPSPIRRFVRAYVREGKAYLEGHTGGNGDIYSGHGINAMLDIPAGTGSLEAGDTVTAVLL